MVVLGAAILVTDGMLVVTLAVVVVLVVVDVLAIAVLVAVDVVAIVLVVVMISVTRDMPIRLLIRNYTGFLITTIQLTFDILSHRKKINVETPWCFIGIWQD